MLAASFEAFGKLTPRADRMMPAAAAFALALAASHGVVNRVHYHTANVRPSTQPTGSSSLTARNIHVIGITDLPDGRVSVLVDLSDFTRRHPHQSITGFAVIQDGLLAGAASDLTTSARNNLKIVDDRS
jgi:hypothetical protein